MNCLPCFGNKESESKEQEDLPIAQTKGHPSSQSTGMHDACMFTANLSLFTNEKCNLKYKILQMLPNAKQ